MSIDLQRQRLLEKINTLMLPSNDVLDAVRSSSERSELFENLALAVFRFQYENNLHYRTFCELLGVDYEGVKLMSEIPFFPIQFFKNHKIQTGAWDAELIFSSSGTTGNATSQHLVRDEAFYLKNTVYGFENFYGQLSEYCILALLPSYLERKGSGLISMAAHFIKRSKYPQSGFFLNDFDELISTLKANQKKGIPTLLIGVSFALLDLAERYAVDLEGVIVMETGGMKGRRKEITREELHDFLKKRLNISEIHSEYGMTELFSQGYSNGDGIFHPAPTMRVLTREITDPLSPQKYGKTGAINIIDLANLDTISFIATDDLGRVYEDNSFEILGRMDASDARGCNLLLIE